MIAKSKKTSLKIQVSDIGEDTFSGIVTHADEYYKMRYYSDSWELSVFNIVDQENKSIEAPSHYNNTNGSLYEFAELHGLNSWEFDILKRTVRCRKKGNFVEDLEKTKFLIDLYLKEYKEC